MATQEQLAEWIVANEDKKGTPDFETVVAAYKELRGSTPTDIDAERARIEEERKAKLAEIAVTPVEEEDDDGGFLDDITPDQLEEFLKGLGGGAAGLLESAALGAITPFAEETESKLREKIQDFADPVQEFFAPDAGSEDLVGRKLGEGVGSFLGILGSAAIPVVGLPLAGSLAVGAGAGEASERAREGGATEEERGLASLLGAGVGATELISPISILNKFRKAVGGEAADGIVASAKRIFQEAGLEGAQEFVAGVGQNLIEKGIYNPERGAFQGTGEQFAIGAGVGGFVQTVMELVTPRGRGRRDDVPPEEPVVTTPPEETPVEDTTTKKTKTKREEIVEAKAKVPEEIDPFAEETKPAPVKETDEERLKLEEKEHNQLLIEFQLNKPLKKLKKMV